MSKDDPFLIVGGGIGGLAAALALARVGLPSLVLEQSASFREIGAGIQLSPNAFRMFEQLGIEDAVSRDAVFVDELRMMDSTTGEPITRVPLGDALRARFGKPYAVTHRADLHGTLLEACRGHGDLIKLETDAKVVGHTDDGDGVSLRLADGTARTGRALIGADGLWSKIRSELVGDGPPIVSGHIAYRAVLPFNQVPEEVRWNAACLWAGHRNHLVHYPLRRNSLFNLVAVFHSDRYVEGWDLTGDRSELMRCFQGVDGRVMGLLERINDWKFWVLCDREPIREWCKGRVALLGDAAHPMLQYFAQGATMAMEDAVCLAEKLADAGEAVPAAFEAYRDARYLRTARVQLTARFLGDLYHAGGVRAELRNQVLAQRTPEQAREGLAWLYDGP
jgi:2-polyprenyl-6-methoxyphenol hydroxylase-like FAD-dependent oxidoreductase